MYRSRFPSMLATLALALLLPHGSVVAQEQQQPKAQPQQQQPPKSSKDMLAGTWTLLLSDNEAADGTQAGAFGPNPYGQAIFTPDGHFSVQIIRSNIAKFAANDRLKGTPDEYKAVVQGMLSYFGTYTIDDASKTLNLRVEASSYPNWDGTRQQRKITALTDDTVTWTNSVPSSAVSGAVRVDLAWRKMK
jgi:hypothetical protein